MCEVTLVATEVVVPVTKKAVNDGAQIELGTEIVEYHAVVNAWHRESSIICLERMHAFRELHGQIDNQVELHGDLANLNWLEGP